jgi:hypothetical protein
VLPNRPGESRQPRVDVSVVDSVTLGSSPARAIVTL